VVRGESLQGERKLGKRAPLKIAILNKRTRGLFLRESQVDTAPVRTGGALLDSKRETEGLSFEPQWNVLDAKKFDGGT